MPEVSTIPDAVRMRATLVALCLGLVACTQSKVPIKFKYHQLKTHPAPAAWRDVRLGSVTGATERGRFREREVVLDPPAPEALRTALQQRLPTPDQGEVTLTVHNVRYAIYKKMFGVAAEFVLTRGQEQRRIAIEHSINSPRFGVGGTLDVDGDVPTYGRAITDLTDRLLYHPEALQFLRSTEAPERDSALLEELDVGPVYKLAAQGTDREATGRVLWGPGETERDYGGRLMLGEAMKGLTGTFGFRNTSQHVGLRGNFGFGVLAMGPSEASTSGGLITGTVGLEIGYIQTRYTERGYVSSPGITAVAVPQFTFNQMFGEGAFMASTFMGGTSFEVDVPLHKYFGVKAALFIGSGYMSGSAGSGDTRVEFGQGLGFMLFPFGDLYVRTSTSRYSLGLFFQQVQNGSFEDLYKNPIISFTYQSLVGRGVAYSRSETSTPVYDHDTEKVLSEPSNVFATSGALIVEGKDSAVAAAQHPAGAVAQQAAMNQAPAAVLGQPPGAASQPGGAAAPAAPAAAPLKIVIGKLVVPPALGAQATELLHKELVTALGQSKVEVVDAATAAQHAALIGVAKVDTPESGRKVLRSVGGSHYLQGSIALQDQQVSLQLELHGADDKGSATSVQQRAARAELILALRELAQRLVKQARAAEL